MRRALLVATLTLAAAPFPLWAQDTAAPPVTVNGVMLPVPPLPSIGLPLPHIGLDVPTTKPQADERTDADPATRPRRPGSAVPPVFVYAPVIVGAGTTSLPGESAPAKPAAATRQGRTGSLTIDTKDDDTPFAVFVDGLYAGSSDQLGASLTLDAGVHQVEVQADGHTAQRFSVRIAAGKTTTHSTDLRAAGSVGGITRSTVGWRRVREPTDPLGSTSLRDAMPATSLRFPRRYRPVVTLRA